VAGATALKLFVETPAVVITAWLFIVLGLAIGAFGTWRFESMRRRINRRMPEVLVERTGQNAN